MKKTLTIALLALAAHAHAADPTFSAITITGTAALPATTTVSGTAFGGAAWLNTGTAAGTVAAGDASRIVNAVQVGGTTTNLTVTGTLNAATLRTSGTDIALGAGASAVETSVAIGSGAVANIDSVSIGNNAYSDSGVAIGANANTGGWYGAVQLGSGTATADETLQFRSYQLLDVNGKIPQGRLPADISVTGSLGVNGNTTLGDASGDTLTINAGTVTAPNATAASAASVMTRELTGMEALYSIGLVFRGGVPSYGSANGGAASVSGQDRLSTFSSSTTAASYGRVTIQRGLTTVPAMSGAGINFAATLSVATRVALSFSGTRSAIRLVVGANGGAPAAADAAPLAVVGFGWEAAKNVGVGGAKFRAIAHNGTTLSYSSWTTGNYADSYPIAVVVSSAGGTVTLSVAGIGSRTFETVSTTGGPTTLGVNANSYVDLSAVSPSATGEICSGGLLDAVFSMKY